MPPFPGKSDHRLSILPDNQRATDLDQQSCRVTR